MGDSMSEVTNPTSPKKPKKKRTAKSYAISFFIKAAMTTIALWVLLYWIAGVFVCHNNSAYPMIKDGDLCITYRLGKFVQGDVIAYKQNGEIRFGRVIAAGAASLAMVASMALSMPLGASTAGTNYAAVNGSTTSFDKYLVMDEGSNVPNVSFEYTVTAGTAQNFDASGKTIAVYSGPTPENIVFSGTGITDTTTTDSKFEIGFAQADTSSAVLQANKGASDYVKNLDAGEKYAKKTATLSFANVAFTEPGIYRYVITETVGNAQGVTYDSDSTRILDVYVEDVTPTSGANAGVKTLQVSQYILHATESTVTINETTYGSDGQVITGKTTQTPGVETSDYKSQGFTNEYSSYDITFSKAVTGNQASKDKYFAFTVKIENAVAGTVYDVSYATDSSNYTTDGDADANISANPNNATTCITTAATQPATLTIGSNGTIEQVFYLQHGQKIAIRGLAKGTKYTITEAPEDYTPSAVATAGTDKNTGDATAEGSAITLTNNAMSDDYIKGNAIVDFTNTRTGTIPTGILLSVAAPAAVGVVVIGGIAYLLIKNKRREAEEE